MIVSYKNKYSRLVLVIFGATILSVIWWVATTAFGNGFLPTPLLTLGSFLKPEFVKTISLDTLISVARVIVVLGASLIMGLALGGLTIVNQKCEMMFSPLVDFGRSIPSTAMLPVAAVFLGYGEFSRIAVPSYACGLILAVSVKQGASNVSESLRWTAELYQLSKWERLKYMILPSVITHIEGGFKTIASLGLVLVIIGEMILNAEQGLGASLIDFRYQGHYDWMMANLLIMGFVGLLLNEVGLRAVRFITYLLMKIFRKSV